MPGRKKGGIAEGAEEAKDESLRRCDVAALREIIWSKGAREQG
jgi:hypothetical protein